MKRIHPAHWMVVAILLGCGLTVSPGCSERKPTVTLPETPKQAPTAAPKKASKYRAE